CWLSRRTQVAQMATKRAIWIIRLFLFSFATVLWAQETIGFVLKVEGRWVVQQSGAKQTAESRTPIASGATFTPIDAIGELVLVLRDGTVRRCTTQALASCSDVRLTGSSPSSGYARVFDAVLDLFRREPDIF